MVATVRVDKTVISALPAPVEGVSVGTSGFGGVETSSLHFSLSFGRSSLPGIRQFSTTLTGASSQSSSFSGCSGFTSAALTQAVLTISPSVALVTLAITLKSIPPLL